MRPAGTPPRPAGISIVIPTIGRPSLAALLAALAADTAPDVPVEILVVDDRPPSTQELATQELAGRIEVSKVVTGPGAGPAAARNAGWRVARHDWVAFLDDDVLPEPGWLRQLVDDLCVPDEVGGVQGRIRVPVPADRRPTDWERVTAGLARGQWITADMAYRWVALDTVGGFDQRFPRAFREDAELAYRVRAAGWQLRRGRRTVTHPVRAASRWISIRTQGGNADDALLRRLYGPRWRAVLDVPPGRRRRHLAVTAAGAAAVACAGLAAATGRRGWRHAAAAAGGLWCAGTAEFARTRIAPGPRDRNEVTAMLVTSAVIPAAAVTHWVRGWWRWRGVRPTDRVGTAHTGQVATSSITMGTRQP